MVTATAGTRSSRSMVTGVLIAVAVLALPAWQYAWARVRHLPPLTMQPVPPVAPQFNDPGPQIHISPPGNPVEQLAPIESMKPPPSSLGIK